MFPLAALAGPLLKGIFSVVDQAVEDKDLALQIKAKITEKQQDIISQELTGAIDIIKAEASSGSWLAANWRPLTMMIFVGMVVSWWFGFTPERATPELMEDLFDLIKIGLGGYVVGRSAEKAAKNFKT